MTTEEMKGLIAELRANPWYMRVYVILFTGSLAAVTAYEIIYAPAVSILKHFIDGSINLSFLAYGSLALSVIGVDVVQYAWVKRRAIMGILIPSMKEKHREQAREQVRREMEEMRREGMDTWLLEARIAGEANGEKRGEARGEARGKAIGEARGRREMASESAAWLADMRQAQKEGREFNEPPPWERDAQDKND